MKKLLLLISCAALTHTHAQLNNSLTACYAFNGSASDAISALNGTLSAVTSTVDRNSVAASAYSFSGSTNSYIKLPNDVKIKSPELSFSAWIKPVVTSGSQYIVFAKSTASSNFEGYALAFDGSGKLIGAKGNNGTVANAFGTTSITSNTWHHVVMTYDNSSLKLYLDGVIEATVSSAITPNFDAAKGVILGGSNESFNLPYTGCMDNVRFYNRAITSAEVTQLYSQDPACVTVATDLTSSLTACYALNTDASEPISSLTGTLGAVTATVDRANAAASAFSFSGSATSMIKLPNNSKIKSPELSFSAWIKPVLTNSSQYIVFAKNTASSNFEGYGLVVGASGNLICIKGNNGTVANATGTSTFASNTWHHVVMTLDNSSLKLYLDGVLDASANSTIVANFDPSTGVVLGGSNESFNLPYTGCMDNVRFYNRAINSSEVSMLFSQDPACVTNTTTTGMRALTNFNTGLKLYPNPTAGKLNIELAASGDGEYQVISTLGTVILQGKTGTTGSFELNLDEFAKGIYFVEVVINGQKLIQKVVKE